MDVPDQSAKAGIVSCCSLVGKTAELINLILAVRPRDAIDPTPYIGEGWGGRLLRHAAVADPAAAALREHQCLEGAETGHVAEVQQLVAMRQIAVARRTDQPARLRPVQAAMEEVAEFGHRPARAGEHGPVAAAGVGMFGIETHAKTTP
jgi:hypothetical protein